MKGLLAAFIGLLTFGALIRPKEAAASPVLSGFDFRELISPVSLSGIQTQDAFSDAFNLIRRREGLSLVAYNDNGHVSVGYGHLITDGSIGIGDTITQQQADAFFKSDMQKAFNAAKSQARTLGINDSNFIAVLTSVNYQLGTNWMKEHPRTWAALKNKKPTAAIAEIKSSLWHTQTPTRTSDFIGAINNVFTTAV